VLVLLPALGVTSWVERRPLLAWYYVRGLSRAGDREREVWVQRVLTVPADALPGLLDGLCDEDARACANCQAGLARLVHQWGPADPRALALGDELASRFTRLSVAGQQGALRLQLTWLRTAANSKAPAREQWQHAGRLLVAAGRATDREVRSRAFELAALLMAQAGAPDTADDCREFLGACLRADQSEVRLRAIRLSEQPGLLRQVVPLLGDSDASVRRAAMLAVGPAQDVVLADELLHALHDSDPEVRRLCEAALRGRHLSDGQIRLGRLITDERPAVRLQVLASIEDCSDLEPGVWLRRLSHDPEPAVRIAALRAATEQSVVDLSDRIDQMAQSDPSPSVCQLARYYLSYQKSHSSSYAGP